MGPVRAALAHDARVPGLASVAAPEARQASGITAGDGPLAAWRVSPSGRGLAVRLGMSLPQRRRHAHGDASEMPLAGIVGDRAAPPEGDIDRIGQEVTVRAIRRAVIDVPDACPEGRSGIPAGPGQAGQIGVVIGAGEHETRRPYLGLARAIDDDHASVRGTRIRLPYGTGDPGCGFSRPMAPERQRRPRPRPRSGRWPEPARRPARHVRISSKLHPSSR
jgi:hypothetical protein